MNSRTSTIEFDLKTTPISFRSLILNTKKNRYASPDMKLLISKYKKKLPNKKNKTNIIPDLRNDLNINSRYNTVENDKKIFPNIHAFSSPNLLNQSDHLKNKAKTINIDNKSFFKILPKKNSILKPNYRNFINEFLTEYYTKKHASHSIYKTLNVKKNVFIQNINKYIHRIEPPKNKIIFGLSPIPTKSKNLDLKIPERNNITLYNKYFQSPAIGERYERHMNELLRLKHAIKNIKVKEDKKKEQYAFRILSNYLSLNGIFDRKYYSENCLSNFKDFLEIDFEVNPLISYKVFLYEILNGEFDKYIQNPMDSNNSSILYYENHSRQNSDINYYVHHS